jgi:maltoporin
MKTRWIRVGVVWLGLAVSLMAQDSTAELRKELDALRGDYEKRIDRLESRIRELEAPTPRHAAHKETAPAADTQLAAAQERENQASRTQEAARKAVDQRFKEDTETRDIARHPDAENMLAERIEDVLEGYLDITGYFRAGYGRSDEGGSQQAFGAPGVAKYRLGNEAENYGELAFAKTFYPAGVFSSAKGTDANDPVARMVYRMSFYNPYVDYGSASNTDFASPELWGSLANVIPGMPDAKIWAGNRFYRRHDIHINDFYFWDMSGGGAGIEDVTLGNGKFAVAWIGDGSESAIYSQLGNPDPLNLAGFSKTSFDFRYYDWKFLGGTGEVGLTYSRADSGEDSDGNQADDAEGVALNLVRTDEGFLDKNSLHKLSLQVGTGPAKTFTSGFDTFSNETGTYIRPDPNESWRFRITDQVVVKPIEEFSIGSALVYQYTDYGDDAPHQEWVSGGVRPIWHITDAFSLAFEGGVDWVSETANGNGGTLGKLTIAPQVSLGDQFFSRPVLRAFVTYAAWSDGFEGDVGGPDYAGKTSGLSWGVQMESWW